MSPIPPLDPLPIPAHLPDGWREVLEAIDGRHVDAHKRIRDDLERTAALLTNLTQTVDRNYNYFIGQQAALQIGINEAKALASRPIEGTTVVWSTKNVLAIVGAVALAVSGYLDLRGGQKDTNRELKTFMDAQTKVIADMQKQRDQDKRDAESRLTQFLTQQLDKTTSVAAAQAAAAGHKGGK